MSLAFLGGGVNVGFDSTSFIGQNPAKITFTWTKFGGGSVPDDTKVFSLAFKRLGGPFSPVGFATGPVAVEVTDKDGNDLLFQTITGGVQPLDNVPPAITCPANVVLMASAPMAVPNIAPLSVTDNCSSFSVGWTTTGATTGSHPTSPDASGSVFSFGVSDVVYKVTDVGGNTSTCSFTITLNPSLTSDTLTIIAQNGTASCGQSLSMDITALNFDSLGSLQFSLGWNPNIIQFTNVSNFNPALLLTSNNFNTNISNTGALSFNWTTNSLSGTTIPQGAVLFTVNFTVNGSSGGSSPVNFTDNPSIREAYTSATMTPSEVGVIWVNGIGNVQDIIPPTLVCPQNVSISVPNGTTSATINNLAPTTLSDNCSGTVGLTYVRNGASNSNGTGNADGTYNAGTTYVTYTATDGAGNSSTCSFTVVVNAGTPVTIKLDSVAADCQATGASITVNMHVKDFNNIVGLQFSVMWDTAVLKFTTVDNYFPGLNLNPSQFNGFQGTQNGMLAFAGGNSSGWPAIPDGGVFFSLHFTVKNSNGTSIIKFVGPFEADNIALDIVPVQPINGYFASVDLTPPAIVCPANITVAATNPDCSASNVSVPIAQATDACSGVASVEQNPSTSDFPNGNTLVTFKATDNVGNTSVCSMTVTVTGGGAPQLTNCPADITVDAPGSSCLAHVDWTPPQATGPCGNANLTVTADHLPGSFFPVGPTTVKYTATDAQNNTATCTFLVTVRDTVAPVLTCPGDLTITPGMDQCCVKNAFVVPTATDNCDLFTQVTGDYGINDNFCTGTTAVHYMATDASGNTTTCVFHVSVTDAIPPVITKCPADITMSSEPDTCGAHVTWTLPEATDNCQSGNLPVVSTDQPGEFFPVGTTQITYHATDLGGNVATCSFSVTIADSIAPIIVKCPLDITVDLPLTKCDTIVNWLKPTAKDNCSAPTLTSDIQPNSTFPAGITKVTYTAVDASGNSAIPCVFKVTVRDLVKPSIACPTTPYVEEATGPCGTVPTWSIPPAIDNCSVPVISSPFMPGDTFLVGTHTFQITATDASNNVDTCNITITINGIPPGFNNLPENINLTGCPQTVDWIAPTPAGICVLDSVTSNYHPGDMFPIGTTTVIYTAYDHNGNTVTASFNVTITENVPPVITCPQGAITVNTGGQIVSDPSEFLISADTISGCNGAKLFFDLPLATDNCGVPSVTQSFGPLSGMAFPIGSDTLFFKATDGSGNTAQCPVVVKIVPIAVSKLTINPNPGCPGEIITLSVDPVSGATKYHWSGPNGFSVPDSVKNKVFISSLAAGNTGLYQVSVDVNGCLSPTDSATLVMVAKPKAVDDTNLPFLPGQLDSFPSILLNDILVPPTDFAIKTVSQLTGLTVHPDGTFTYQAGDLEQSVSFIYEVCSKSCPDLCSMATVTLIPNDTSCTFIPNIFTPNNDGMNDLFKIPCLDASGSARTGNSIVIYNQWGTKVFEASPYSNAAGQAWTGTYNNVPGKELPDGVYYYVFKPGVNQKVLKGFVEIFR
jgi:gliding motility-associated-like protein